MPKPFPRGSYVFVDDVVLGNVGRIYGALHNVFSSHCSLVDNLHQVNEVLLVFEATNKFGVVWGTKRRGKVKQRKKRGEKEQRKSRERAEKVRSSRK